MKSIGKAAFVGAGILLASGSALAATPYPNLNYGGNRWRITIYDDTSSTHGAGGAYWQHDICVAAPSAKGMGITGAWYSLSYPNWYGAYYQEGDHVRLRGGYPFYYSYGFMYAGRSHMSCELISNSLATCSSADFMHYYPITYPMLGLGSFWGNATMQRIGTCAAFTADTVADLSKNVCAVKTGTDGKPVSAPAGLPNNMGIVKFPTTCPAVTTNPN